MLDDMGMCTDLKQDGEYGFTTWGWMGTGLENMNEV